MLTNVKVNEFCCGFTLRTGSLILFWTFLVIESISTLIYLYQLLHSNKYEAYDNVHYFNDNENLDEKAELHFLTRRSLYYLITTISGMVFSIFGILGIEKNVPRYLTFGLYYFGYKAVYAMICIPIIIISPEKFLRYTVNMSRIGGDVEEVAFAAVAAYLFVIAIVLYFWITIRSCRDSMLRNIYSGDSTHAIHIPEESKSGYSYNVA